MINFLSSWVKNLSLALIIVSILEMILPNNKTKKYIKIIMGIYILFSIISPFVENSSRLEFDNINIYINQIEETSDISKNIDTTSMDTRLNEIYRQELEKNIIQKIEEKNYDVENCKVVAHISENDSGIEKITLKVNKKVDLDSGNENKIEKKIVTEIQKIQKIQKVEINSSKANSNSEETTVQETTNLTETDIKIISDLLIKEYGVSKKCLKIS